MATQDRIKELLGTGLSNEVVASSIGVHPSYISQLMSDENFYNEVIELRTKALAANTVRDRSIDSLEDSLIRKIGEVIDQNLVYKPMELLRYIQVINAMKRRGVQAHEANVVNNTIVNLQLPQAAQKNFSFKTNTVNEVVEVEGQTLVTMPAASLLQKLIEDTTSDDEQKKLKYEQVKKYLPQSAFDEAGKVIEAIKEQGTGELKDESGQTNVGTTNTIKSLSNLYKSRHGHSKTAGLESL